MTVPEPIDKPPTLNGPHGRAWLTASNEKGIAPGAVVAMWIVEADWAHPFWHSYQLSLIHLRPAEGLPEPVIHLVDATHEIVLMALDPNQPRTPALEGGLSFVLTSANFAAQFVAITDAEAFKRVEKAVHGIIEGRLSPDTDYVRLWIKLFGDNMIEGHDAPGSA